ncbi:MAG: ABC transporter ATP-binding protein [Ruminiclostridium sp.]|nr:ABC transporter ATP-binding protein [Ruminiclostridium sp.]
MEKVMEINGLTKLYKNGRGIRDVNLEISRGEIFGFLGPNGAGKTTAMKIMTGLMKPDRGNVRIFGYSICDEYEKAIQKVGCIIETAESYPYLTAYENLKQVSRFFHGIDDGRIDEVLDITGMLKYRNERAGSFSLGMKQRLGLAAAILSRPELVILDEPLNGLDVEGMLQIRKLVKHLSETENVTFFISSHLIHDVELTCNRIGIILGGKFLGADYTDNILANHDSLENYFVSEVNRNGSI